MTLRPPLSGSRGATAATHWLASATAMATLSGGGNAFDAAAAAGFVLQVVEPHSNGLGGDVVILTYRADTGQVRTVCGQGPMPAAASPAAFHRLGLTSVPAAGLLPATVPGAFGAWLRLLGEFGSERIETVLEPAIAYAGHGYPLLPAAARTIAAMEPLFAQAWPGSAQSYLVDGRAPAAWSRMRHQELAGTLQRLANVARNARTREAGLDAAHQAFYQGFVAEAIDRFVGVEVLDSTGRSHPGLLTGDDLARWQPAVEPCAQLRWHDLEVFKAGPWSQGPVFLQQLGILAGDDLAAEDPNGEGYIHLLAETAKLALADREAWYGDPPGVPPERLLDASYLEARRELIDGAANPDPQPGRPEGSPGWSPRAEVVDDLGADRVTPPWLRELRIGIPTVSAPGGAGNTCTVVVADRFGNLCAAVPSGGWLKSSPVIPGLGLSLGTRGQTTWLQPGHPNSLRPGHRPRTTLSPTIALRDGRPYLALGTPGGDQQDQWTLQTFLRVAVHDQDLAAAAEAPAFHSDHFPLSFAPRTARPNTLVIEGSVSHQVRAALRDRGHRLDVVPEGTLGKVCVVGVDPGTGFLRAAAGDRGRQAYAICG